MNSSGSAPIPSTARYAAGPLNPVDWIDLGNEQGVLYIDVPEQPRACLPYVVAAPAGRDGNGKNGNAEKNRQGSSHPGIVLAYQALVSFEQERL